MSPLLAIAALAVHGLTGQLRIFSTIPGPRSLARQLAARLTPRLDRPNRGDRTLAFRGALLATVIGGSAAGVGSVLDSVLYGDPVLRLAEIIVLASCLSFRRSWQEAAAAINRLQGQDLNAAARALGLHGRIDDAHAVARSGVERLSIGLARGMTAPLFWYLLAGLPGALLATAMAAMAASLADQRSSPPFARAPQLAHAALSAPPALLSALLIAAAAIFVPGGRPVRALSTLLREFRRWPQQGLRWPIASAAGALGLALGGRSSYAGWIGQGRARATERDLKRMLLVAAVACLLVVCALAACAVVLLAV